MTKKVIIIDDSSTQLNVLKSFFAKEGWEVYGAQSAKIAYEMIFDCTPDLIITDAIMPAMGGFALIKLIRENELISKIPIIVYSVLNEINAKFYVREELSEYFLRKDNNQDELLKLAQSVVEKYPLDEDYKTNILKAMPSFVFPSKQPPEPSMVQEIIPDEPSVEAAVAVLDKDELELKFKENYDFSHSDDKILSDIFPILFGALDYNLCVISFHSFEQGIKKTYFDIRNILLSPILRDKILAKFNSKESVLFKKYAPNLKMIVNEDEFYSKIEFEFEYKGKNTANIAFYSRDKEKWENLDDINTIKYLLDNFFKARHINKSTMNARKDNKFYNKNSDIGFLNKNINSKNPDNIYVGIISISNFQELASALTLEELDIVNSKITEKIINCIERDEQIYKNDVDEYNIVITARDEKQALLRLNNIANIVNSIVYNTYQVEALIGASNCSIDNNFNIPEAQKKARDALDNATKQEKAVIG